MTVSLYEQKIRTQIHTKERLCEDKESKQPSATQGGCSEETNPANTLILDLQPLDL